MLDYYRFKTVSDLFMQGKMEEGLFELAELQHRYVALSDENATFKMQVQEYEDVLHLARNLILDGKYYWLMTGEIRQGPFCPGCYERDGLLMRLTGASEERFCAICRERFADSSSVRELAVPMTPDLRDAVPSSPGQDNAKRKAKVIPFGR